MAEIRFTVPGILPGWQRAGKSGKRHFTEAQTRDAKVEVAAWARQAAAGKLLAGPLGMEMTVWLPAKGKASEGGYVAVKPDLDNLVKLVMDACNKVAWKDDAQVARQVVEKRYGAPRAEVRVWELVAADRATQRGARFVAKGPVHSRQPDPRADEANYYGDHGDA